MFSRLSIWADHLRRQQGKSRYAFALLYGAVAALAFPPFNAVVALWFCFPALVFLLQGTKNRRQAFAVGWCFSFALLVVSLYWITGSMLVDIRSFWWAVPLSLTGLPAMFAFYYGAAALAAKRWGLQRLDGLLVLALAWFLADVARGHLMTGFPWDVTGYVWGDILPVMQIASVIGIYGLTLLTLVLVVLPAALFKPVRNRFSAPVFVMSLIFLAAVAGWGSWRLARAPDETVPDVRLRLVQTNVAQNRKWQDSEREKNFQDLLDITFAPAEKPVTHFIWPETATAYYLTENNERRKEIAARMPPGAHLVTGVVRRGPNENLELDYYNSMIAMDSRGNVVAGYDKFHLVPFGEYIPFNSLLNIRTLVVIGSGFTAGEGPRSMRVAGLPPFSPLICYEVIFPGGVIDETDPPQFLLNATNDAWYEHTIGPYQHFMIARTRAIEEGLPLVRVANKGVVAVTDAYGRVKAQIGWDKATFVDSDLPKALPEKTPFRRFGPKLLWALAGALLALAALLGLLRK